MIEAVMLWNEPNNLSHWDFEMDPEWKIFSSMVRASGQAVRAENPRVSRVLGGISPIDPGFMETLRRQDGLSEIDVVVTDSGITQEQAEDVRAAGCQVLVAGTDNSTPTAT